MEQPRMSHGEPGGNTKSPGKKATSSVGVQCYRWQFTLKASIDDPNDPVGVTRLIEPRSVFDNLSRFCKEFYYQLEQGADGYMHYQGCLSLNTKHRLLEVKDILGWSTVHVERAMNWHALVNYSKKVQSRVSGPWSHMSVWIDTIEPNRRWQLDLLDIIQLKCDDNRTIHWLWEPIGKVGKTQFCKWCAVELGATILKGGALKDIAFSIPDNPKIIIFDLPRTMEERVNYDAIESCKDGMIFSAKYESKMKIFNSPHVVILANFAPEYDCLSLDRWKVQRISIDR